MPRATKTLDELANEIEPNAKVILREAIIFARGEVRIERRVWGRRRSSLAEIAAGALERARDRDLIRRRNAAHPAWAAQFSAIEREIAQIETRLAVMAGGYRSTVERSYQEPERLRLISRLAELRGDAEIARAA